MDWGSLPGRAPSSHSSPQKAAHLAENPLFVGSVSEEGTQSPFSTPQRSGGRRSSGTARYAGSWSKELQRGSPASPQDAFPLPGMHDARRGGTARQVDFGSGVQDSFEDAVDWCPTEAKEARGAGSEEQASISENQASIDETLVNTSADESPFEGARQRSVTERPLVGTPLGGQEEKFADAEDGDGEEGVRQETTTDPLDQANKFISLVILSTVGHEREADLMRAAVGVRREMERLKERAAIASRQRQKSERVARELLQAATKEIYALSEENEKLSMKLAHPPAPPPKAADERPQGAPVRLVSTDRSTLQGFFKLLLLTVVACGVLQAMPRGGWSGAAGDGNGTAMWEGAIRPAMDVSSCPPCAASARLPQEQCAPCFEKQCPTFECPAAQEKQCAPCPEKQCPTLECPAVQEKQCPPPCKEKHCPTPTCPPVEQKECPAHECPACQEKHCPPCEMQDGPGGSADCLMMTQSLSMCANQVSAMQLQVQRLEKGLKRCTKDSDAAIAAAVGKMKDDHPAALARQLAAAREAALAQREQAEAALEQEKAKVRQLEEILEGNSNLGKQYLNSGAGMLSMQAEEEEHLSPEMIWVEENGEMRQRRLEEMEATA